MLIEPYKSLYNRLTAIIDKSRIFHDPLYTLAFGSDASYYRLIPKLVIKAKNESEISFLLKEAGTLKIPVTFRAAGTSLSGQAVSDSVLVITGDHWKKYEILDGGMKIRLQPGILGGKVNSILLPYQRKIGPDPASINSAMIGGIAANNASGMCCGTAENSYKTLHSMKIIFHDGSVLDTSDEKSKSAFLNSHAGLITDLGSLAESVKKNTPLADRIRRKYKMKNTTGYSLNALVDFEDPFEIIQHLMIGSEGTLGFISEITYKTVPELPFKASSLIIFPDIAKACEAVSLLKSEPVSAVELIDRAGLRSVENSKGLPYDLKVLGDQATALLVETRADSAELLHRNINVVNNAIHGIPMVFPIRFTDIPEEFNALWKIRKGLFPSVGAMRRAGTTVIIEDVAFPVPRLGEATIDLQTILKNNKYDDAVIFGHALEGNLHFVFSQDFNSERELKRYENMIRDVTGLVVDKYDGSLKAEHGTGRNMAPFVEKEWGREAYEIMKQIKNIFDPDDLLNPGVILNQNPRIHLENIKPLPVASEKIDKCIECGFCEPSCVSAGLTLTPRQRIVSYREISRLRQSHQEPHLLASLQKWFEYHGNATCATDGLCAQECPVEIDTGKLIKELRFDKHTPFQDWIADRIAGNMAFVTSMARGFLSFVSFFHSILGTALMKAVTGSFRWISFRTIPLWTPAMPKGSKSLKFTEPGNAGDMKKVVYFPSCINRSMGVSKDHKEETQLTEKMRQLLSKAGYSIIYPENINELCCGMAFSSKGFKKAGLRKSKELENALRKASNNGEYPVLCDMSPCLYTMKDNMEPGLKLYEPVEFILEYLVQNLEITPLDQKVVVFPVCSMKKMGLDAKLVRLAGLCAREVIVPETNCCGFAGDRGFSFPELNAHGLKNLKDQVPEGVIYGYSTSRTCEIGLTTHSGVSFKSIVYLVDQVSKASKVK